MENLLPDKLKLLWKRVDEGQLSAGDFHREQERLIGEYRRTWVHALSLDGFDDLEESIAFEIGLYTGNEDVEEVKRRCLGALSHIKAEWQSSVRDLSRESVERFYEDSQAMIYELMWWHTLSEDLSPLAYVNALQFAEQREYRDFLDFGSGVGSGGILFARHGINVTLADISSAALDFGRWRFERRGLSAAHIDLKTSTLPEAGFDFITAMDVFEHLVDPVDAVQTISRALKPQGFLMGRFHAELDEDRPHHVTLDFSPTFRALEALGFVEVWRDEWLWGHQIFSRI
jgi:2-polyprenyl-3-methyl-5-hydroxy-6-metoxy-1,4-benzoquinol methylase